MDWTEAHRPRSLKDLVGNGPTIAKLRAWAASWQSGTPKQRAVVLAGPPGTGKTSAALALAADMGWTVIELNASDARNAESIKRIATAGAVHATFGGDGSFTQGSRKLIILDEADNLYERLSGENAAGGGSDLSDRGGKAQIIDTIRRTQQPMILIVNDLYALQKGSGSALRALAEVLKFARVQARSIVPALERIVRTEGVHVERDVLEAVAQKADGDLRAAVRDLESLCLGRTKVTRADLASLGTRDHTGTLFDMVRHVLKGRRLDDLRRSLWEVDATPEDMVLWIDENLPKEYRDPEDLVRGYDRLSRADVFLGRTRRTQHYGLWSYASELSTLGVMTARRREYREFVPFGFPQYLSKMSRTRGLRQTKDLMADRIGTALHLSKRKARTEQVETLQALFQMDAEFAAHVTADLEITDEEVALLLGPESTAGKVKKIRAAADALLAEKVQLGSVEAGGPLKQAGAGKTTPRTGAKTRALGDGDEDDGAATVDDVDDQGEVGTGDGTDADDAGGADDDAPKRPRPPSKGQARLF